MTKYSTPMSISTNGQPNARIQYGSSTTPSYFRVLHTLCGSSLSPHSGQLRVETTVSFSGNSHLGHVQLTKVSSFWTCGMPGLLHPHGASVPSGHCLTRITASAGSKVSGSSL